MSRFDNYFLMKVEDVFDYVQEKINYFDEGADVEVKEIGDGNLNYVFKAVDKNSDKSVIVKHAGPNLRIDSGMTASPDRNRIESEILVSQFEMFPGSVPEVYHYDTTMSACIMEDLSDHQMMRTAMLKNEIFPRFADDITDFVVKTQLGTTDLIMEQEEKKNNVKSFINPDLCKITEDLVLTEPYNDVNNRNLVFEPNKEFVEKELYNDDELKLEVSKLKFKFMNYPQALIHGDLHTGSVFVKQDSTKVFDPEFAFYGPIGYDLGNVVANLLFAWCNGYSKNNKEFCEWTEESIVKVIDQFKEKAESYLKENVNDVMAKNKGFIEYYIDSILEDTAGYTGTELHRRIVGMAQVLDITTIEDEEMRTKLERVCILAGKRYIKEADKIKSGEDYIRIWDEVKEEIL